MAAKRASGLDLYLKSKMATAPTKIGPPPPPQQKGRNGRGKNRGKPKQQRRRPVQATARTFGPSMGPTTPDLRQFQLALRDPFHPNAFGARVVDSYSIPTATYHLRANVLCTSSAAGNFCGVILPSPCLSFINAGTGVTLGSVSGSTMSAFGANGTVSYVVSPATMATHLSEYRVVAWGFRVIAKDTAFASKGKFYIAPVPTTNNAPSWNTFATVTGTQAAIGEYTIGMDADYVYNAIVGMPGVRIFSMQDLLRGEVQASGVPCDATFYTFKGTTDRSQTPWNTGQVLADEGVFNNTTGLVNATAGGRKDIASLRGGRAFLIVATGMPASGQEFDIEIIYHLEGTPNMTGTVSATALIPSSTRTTNGASWLVEKAISVAARAGNVVKFLTDPTNQAAATRAVSFLTGM